MLIALLGGLLGGLAISLIAGSRRSSTVVDRFVSSDTSYDVVVYSDAVTAEQRAALLRLPGVVRADPEAFVAFVAPMPDGSVQSVFAEAGDPGALSPVVRVLQGRVPDRSDPSEIAVSADLAKQLGIAVGDAVRLQTYGVEQYDAVGAGEYANPTGPRYRFSVAGIVKFPGEIAADKVSSPGATRYDANFAVVQDAWYWAHQREHLDFGAGYNIQLDELVTTVDDFQASARALFPADAEVAFSPPDRGIRPESLASAVDLETIALLALGTGIALSIAGTVALLLRAEQRDHSHDVAPLRALGYARSEVGLLAMLRALPAAVLAGLLAGVSALVLSGRYPIGVGREIELDPGVKVNLLVVGAGTAVVFVFVVGTAFLLGRPRGQDVRLAPSPDALSRWLARVGAPLGEVLGTHFAFGRRHGSGRPARGAVMVGAAALAVVVASAMFVGGVDRLYAEPSGHGWPWDAVVGNTNFPLSSETMNRLRTDPRIARRTVAGTGTGTFNGATAFILAIDPSGTAPPTVTRGRLPSSPSEVALGSALRRTLGVDVGDSVTLSIARSDFAIADGGTRDVALTVVGEAALPAYGDGDVGRDAVITFDALTAAGGQIEPQIAMVQLRPHHRASDLAGLDRDLSEEIYADLVPARIVNLHRVRPLPMLGLGLAGLMGTTVLAFTLATGVRSRLRDLAVLRALGMEARRLRGVLGWQGLALAGAMVLLGLPFGLVAGTAWWRTVADDLGASPSPAVPPPLLLLLPLTAVVALGTSVFPAWRACRRTGAALLRSE